MSLSGRNSAIPGYNLPSSNNSFGLTNGSKQSSLYHYHDNPYSGHVTRPLTAGSARSMQGNFGMRHSALYRGSNNNNFRISQRPKTATEPGRRGSQRPTPPSHNRNQSNLTGNFNDKKYFRQERASTTSSYGRHRSISKPSATTPRQAASPDLLTSSHSKSSNQHYETAATAVSGQPASLPFDISSCLRIDGRGGVPVPTQEQIVRRVQTPTTTRHSSRAAVPSTKKAAIEEEQGPDSSRDSNDEGLYAWGVNDTGQCGVPSFERG